MRNRTPAAVCGLTAVLALSLASRVGAQGVAADWPGLIRRYEQQVDRAPGDAHGRFTLAVLYARQGRVLDGFRLLREADAAAGTPARAMIARQIIADAESVIRHSRGDLLARYRLAFARYVLGDRAGAATEFERVVAADARNEWAYAYLGQVYTDLGRFDRAIAVWERGLTVNGQNAVLHYLLGVAYARQNDKKKAAVHLAAAYRDRTLYDYVTGVRR